LSKPMKRNLGILFVCGLLIFALLQFFRPSIPTPSENLEVHAPESATKVLRTSCYSCHSNERRLSWFDEIVPAYWLVRRDVLDARRHLNFSTLGGEPVAAQRTALFEAVNMAQLGAMPLKRYTALHPEAKIQQSDLANLKAFLAPWGTIPPSQPDPPEIHTPSVTESAPGGLAFDDGFVGWHLLSVTDRGDNNTFRFILGNDIATKAAREGRVYPWPNGARFAKIAWQQRTLRTGLIAPGEFIQVEMMAKGTEKYRSSDGWGWGRWKGPNLKPYGTDASVVGECTGCHAPMKQNDFVYTMPISADHGKPDALNATAASLPKLPFDPFEATPITMFVDRNRGTISVLFRNDTAIRGSSDLLMVTWHEEADSHWFGARIPGSFLEAESLQRLSATETPEYTRIDQDGQISHPSTAEAKEHVMMLEKLQPLPALSH